jgi:hypothetical protein
LPSKPTDETKTVNDLNPRSKPVKDLEMTVARGIGFVYLFEDLDDWSAGPLGKYRELLGPLYNSNLMLLPELWKRYKDKSLHRQCHDMIENLPLDALSKERKKLIKKFQKDYPA